MNLTATILLLACLAASAKGHTQTVTLDLKNAPIQKVFREVIRQTGASIVYNEVLFKDAPPVTIKVKDATVAEVINKCLQGQPFTFAIDNNAIVIKQKDTPDATLSLSKGEFPLPIDISGRITDPDGKPLEGANVKVKGSKNGTTTNADGIFILKNVDENVIIEISYVGFETQFIPIKNKTSISLALKRSESPLDEIQIGAYSKTSKRLQVGNVTTVKGEDIAKQPVNNPLLALEGRVPGLFITQANGLPGGGVTVRIQGQNSIIQGNDPLYVIDGVPLLSQLPRTGIDNILGSSGTANFFGNPLSYINSADIESIDILKDADATAIYGSRAANGAILITTKKGKAGKAKIDINLQRGWGQVTRKMNMMNTQQYLQMRHEAFRNDSKIPGSGDYDINGIWDSTRYTDWQKTLIGGTSQYTTINGTISGGTGTTQYLVGVTYRRVTTVFPGDFANQSGTVHFNLNSASVNQKFHFQFSGNYSIDNNQLPQTDITSYAIQLAPDAPALYNTDGSLNWAPNTSGTSTWTNPLAYFYTRYKNKTTNLVSNAILSYQILPGLEVRSSFGYTNMQTNDFYPVPLIYNKPENRSSSQRAALYGNRNLNSWVIEPQANYMRTFGGGKLDFLLGITILQNNSNSGSYYGVGYNSDQVLENPTAASTIYVNSAFLINEYKYNALFGRLNYSWKDKYILNITGRRDGSSRYGVQSQFHNFGSIGASWLFSQEVLVRKNVEFLSFGKLRASYGTTGSDQIPDYTFLNLYDIVYNNGVPYQNSTGLAPTGLSNPYLQWEETRKLQLGIDLGFLKDRVLLNATYARNRSSNQLLSYTLPTITGFESLFRNFPAMVQNTSWELALNSTNIKSKNFTWSSSFNLTIPQNKLIEFPNLASSTYARSLIVGKPVNIIKLYSYIGVDPVTGKYLFKDSHGNPTSSPSFLTDQTVLFSTSPKFYGGLQNSFSYKGFHLDFLFQFVKQNGANIFINNGSNFPGQFANYASNQPITVLDHWQKTGDIVPIAKFSTTTRYNSAVSSDYTKEDASYMRLKNLLISWELPGNWKQKAHLQNCRIYLEGQNLMTLTNYKGLDPENQGVSSLPPLRVWMVGLQVGL